MKFRWEWWCCGLALFLAPFVAGYFSFGLFGAQGWEQILGLVSGALPPMGYLIVGLPLLAGFVGAAWRLPVFRLPIGNLMSVFTAFWMLIVFASMASHFPYQSEGELVRWSIELSAFLLIASIAGRGKYALWLGFVIALAGSLEALWAVREYAEAARATPNWRVFGTFFNPDFLAGYLVMVIPVCLAFLASWNGQGKVLAVLLAFLPLPALILTGSRGGLLAFVLSLIAFLVLVRWNRVGDRRFYLSIGLALIAMVAFFGVFTLIGSTGRIVGGGGGESIEHSGSFRKYLWEDSIRMAKERPAFGYGFGAFAQAHGPTAQVGYTRLAHNSYLQLASEAGVPAVIALLVFFAFWLRKVMPREREEGIEAESLFGVNAPMMRSALVAGVIGAAAHNFVDSDVYLLANGLTLWSMMGLALALAVDGMMPLFLPKSMMGLVATAVSLLAAGPLLSQAIASSYASTAQARQDQSDYLGAQEGFQHALDFAPRDRRYLLAVARLELGANKSEAYTLAQRAIREEPSLDTYLGVARMYMAAEDLPRAEWAFKQALTRDPYSVGAQRGLWEIYKNQDRGLELIELAKALEDQRHSTYSRVRAVPEVIETLYSQANLYLAEKGFADYIDAFDGYRQWMMITYPMVIARGRYSPVSEEDAQRDVEGFFTSLKGAFREYDGDPESQNKIAGFGRAATYEALKTLREYGRQEEADALERRIDDATTMR